jgi:hypothetical protein
LPTVEREPEHLKLTNKLAVLSLLYPQQNKALLVRRWCILDTLSGLRKRLAAT